MLKKFLNAFWGWMECILSPSKYFELFEKEKDTKESNKEKKK